jgi:hypothetical protein
MCFTQSDGLEFPEYSLRKRICNKWHSKFLVQFMFWSSYTWYQLHSSNKFGRAESHWKSKCGYCLFGIMQLSLTDNLLKRYWASNSRCQFCNKHENILHHFLNVHQRKLYGDTVGQAISGPTHPEIFSQFFWWFHNFPCKSKHTDCWVGCNLLDDLEVELGIELALSASWLKIILN